MAEKKTDAVKTEEGVGHVTYAYPSQTQAFHAGTHLAKALIGSEPKITNELVNYAYTVIGYGLSIGLPVAPQEGMKSACPDCDAMTDQELGRVFAEHFGNKAAPDDPAALPWMLIISVAWQVIKRFILK